MKINYGRHVLFDFQGTDAPIHDPEYMYGVMTEAIHRTGATILHKHHHKFSPDGLSVVFILQESHMTVHTWYETHSAVFDVYTCGAVVPDKAFEYLLEELKPKKYSVRVLSRGHFYHNFIAHSQQVVKDAFRECFAPLRIIGKGLASIL